MSKKVLFFGRMKCRISLKIYEFLKKKFDTVTFIKSKRIGEKLNENKSIFKKNYDYIFCFRSFYKLSKIIDRVKFYAINFHPSTPKYRGAGGVNYAIYKDKLFGCTAHLMNNEIDNGKIIDCQYFKINKKDNVEKILNKTYSLQLKQVKRIINNLVINKKYISKMIKKNINIKWSKKLNTIKSLDKFYRIDINLNKKKFNQKIKSTVTKKYRPYIVLHGNKFTLDIN